MNEFLLSLVWLYAALVGIKFILCIPVIPKVIGTLARVTGRPRGTYAIQHVILVPVGVFLYLLIWCIPSLVSEGYRYFLLYSNFNVIRDVVRAQRALRGD